MSDRSPEPLSEELEKLIQAAALEGDGMDALNLVLILRAFAREILAGAGWCEPCRSYHQLTTTSEEWDICDRQTDPKS